MKSRALRSGSLGLLAPIVLVMHSAQAEVHPAVLTAETQRVEAIARASQTAVAVFASNGQGGGSAVLISADGYALSNFHVSSAAGTAMKCGLSDGRLYDAVIVGIDPTGDVAMLKLLGRDDFPHAPLADSDEVRVGDWCFAIGNPFLLATDFQPSVSYGVISGVHRYQYPAGTLLEYTDCLQADAAINPGNSGGPLFDAQGRLIGINGRGSFEKRGRVNVGVGYAISINQIKNFLGHLRSGRIVDHATLGARVGNDERRVLVDDILEESDAYRRGLRYGDEVIAFAGRPITTSNSFKNVLGIYPKGWRVPLTYRRKQETFHTLVRLRGVHREAELASLATSSPEAPPEGPPGKKPVPKPKEGEKPKLPNLPLGPAPQPMPQIVQEHYAVRPGYVNYFFNQLEQDRVSKALQSRGDFTSLPATWKIEGELATGGDVRFTLGERAADVNLPGGEAKVDLTGELARSLDPPRSGGLLVALGLWRRLLVGSPSKFGETYYLGTAPVYANASANSLPEFLADVLVGTYGGVECHFMVDPASGQLLAMEMFPDEDDDPCELYFAEYRETDGRFLPYRIEARHGDSVYQVFNLKLYKFE